MLWVQSLPNWLRAPIVAFGVVILARALFPVSELTLPALLIGAIWVLVGWKGLPLVPSIPANPAPSDETLETGLRTIRRRRRIARLVPILSLPFIAMGLSQVPRTHSSTAFVIVGVPIFVLMFRYLLSACPRCGNHFFVGKYLIRTGSMRCRHCGLPLKNGANAA